MAKYSEKGIVNLKKETERLSGEVHDLIEKKESVAKEIRLKEALLTEKQRLFREFDNSIAIHMEGLKKQENTLAAHINELTTESKARSASLATLTAAIAGVEVPVQNFSFVNQATKMLEKRLLDAEHANEISKKETAQLNVEREQVTNELVQIRAEHATLTEESAKLRLDIEDGNDENGKLGREYIKLQEKIREIELRERDSLVMQRRLTPEYQKVFNETQQK